MPLVAQQGNVDFQLLVCCFQHHLLNPGGLSMTKGAREGGGQPESYSQ